MIEMKLPDKQTIQSLLRDTYHRLGVKSVRRLDALASQSWDYLCADREFYISVAEGDDLDRIPEDEDRMICKLLPLAQKVVEDQEEDHIRVHTATFCLMVAEEDLRFVMRYCYHKQYPDPTQNAYGFPMYRYVQSEDILSGLKVRSPRQLRPVATKLDWEAYGMMFSAFARLEKSGHMEYVPQRTERAMVAAEHTEEKTLQVQEHSVTGRPVLLATGDTSPRQYRQDHYYTFRKSLYLLMSEEMPRYLLKTTHTYRYFHKRIYGDEPGACAYEDGEEKLQEEYAFLSLPEIPQNLRPHY